MIKLPRKNAVQAIEADQAKLLKLIDETRRKIKQTTKLLFDLQPDMTDMDPYTLELLLREQKVQNKIRDGKSSGSDSDE